MASRQLVVLALAATVGLVTACSEDVAGRAMPIAGVEVPHAGDKDPSERIEGVVRMEYEAGLHANPGQRVAYDQSPPFGGRHDPVWADCQGTVYQAAVRSEHMVHSLEHGAVWIAYHPDKITGAARERLRSRVEGQPYLMMSPYPGLDRPISLQSWGHQLKLDSADDQRIDRFIAALRQNRYQHPEPRGRCDAPDPSAFDVTNPPPFESEPPGPDAAPPR